MGRGGGGGGRGGGGGGAGGRGGVAEAVNELLTGQSISFSDRGFLSSERDIFRDVSRRTEPILHQNLVDNTLRRGSSRSRSGAARLVNDSVSRLIDAGVIARSSTSFGDSLFSLTPAARRALQSQQTRR